MTRSNGMNPVMWVRELGGLGLVAMMLCGIYVIATNAATDFVADMRNIGTSIQKSVDQDFDARAQVVELFKKQTESMDRIVRQDQEMIQRINQRLTALENKIDGK